MEKDIEALIKAGDIPIPSVSTSQERLNEIWKELSRSQRKAALLYSVKSTLTDVAEAIGINRGTIYMWDNLNMVKEASSILLKDVQEQILDDIAKLAPKAIKKLEQMIMDEDNKTSLDALELFFKHIYRDTKIENENSVTLNIQYVDKENKEIDAEYQVYE